MFQLPIPQTECRIVPDLPALDQLQMDPDLGLSWCDGTVDLPFEGVGQFRIEDGRRILIRPAPGASPETLLLFTKAAPYGILVFQRGELPLHASAIVSPDGRGALLVAGLSGAGKSTTAALLVRKGWKILNDDLSRITFQGSHATAWPGFAILKLDRRSLGLISVAPDSLRPIDGDPEKSYLTLDPTDTPSRVRALVVLDNGDGPFSPPRPLAGPELLRHLYAVTYCPYLVKPLGFQKSHFEALARLTRAVSCRLLEGNRSCAPETLLEQLERCFDSACVGAPG